MIKITKNGREFLVNGNYESWYQIIKTRISNKMKRILGKNVLFDYNRFWRNVQNNRWENHTFTIFDTFLDKDHSYIDIGAWIGPTALYGCQIANHCYAIEPDPIAWKELEQNVSMNPKLQDKITLFQGCIGNTCSTVSFGSHPHCGSHFGNSLSSMLFGKSEDAILVRSITLEKFIQMNHIRNCNFIKMDIEGGETLVLPNIINYLQKNKPTLFLSLHPHLFPHVENDSQKIITALKIYNNVFDIHGKLLDLEYLLHHFLLKKKLCEVIATDKEWNPH